MHGAALAPRIAAAAARELGEHSLGVHTRDQHVAVVAISGDDLVAVLRRHLHPDHDGFLADVEVTKAADEAHAVHLAGFFLEAADEQHLAIGEELFVLRQRRGVRRRALRPPPLRTRALRSRSLGSSLRSPRSRGHTHLRYVSWPVY